MVTLFALALEERSKDGCWTNIYIGTVIIDLVGLLLTYEIAELFFS